MAYEVLENGVELMTSEQILQPREVFFNPVTLGIDPVFCGDERTGNYTGSYFHLMGGALNPVYTNMIVQETNNPGSITTSFAAETATMTASLVEAQVEPGIHSDAHNEPTGEYDPDSTEQAVGCGFAKLRQAVSAHIAANGQAIVSRFSELYPELAESAEDKAFATHTVSAHDRLSQRDSIFAEGGRAVTNAAVAHGARTMVVEGDHNGMTGIINDDPAASYDNNLANDAGLESYVHDAGVSTLIRDRLRGKYEFDERQQQIAEIVDAMGTMNALGVPLENIVRRPVQQAA